MRVGLTGVTPAMAKMTKEMQGLALQTKRIEHSVDADAVKEFTVWATLAEQNMASLSRATRNLPLKFEEANRSLLHALGKIGLEIGSKIIAVGEAALTGAAAIAVFVYWGGRELWRFMTDEATKARSINRDAVSAGATFGGQRAFNLNYQRVTPDPTSIVEAVRRAKFGQNSGEARGLQALGVSPNGDAADVAAAAVSAAALLLRRTPPDMVGQAAEAHHLTDLFDPHTILVLRNLTAAQVAEMAESYRADKEFLSMTEAQAKSWTDFITRVEFFGGAVEAILAKRLVTLTGPLTRLSAALAKLISAFLDSPTFSAAVDMIDDDLKAWAGAIDSVNMADAIAAVDGFVTRAHKLAQAFRAWTIVAAPGGGGAPPPAASGGLGAAADIPTEGAAGGSVWGAVGPWAGGGGRAGAGRWGLQHRGDGYGGGGGGGGGGGADDGIASLPAEAPSSSEEDLFGRARGYARQHEGNIPVLYDERMRGACVRGGMSILRGLTGDPIFARYSGGNADSYSLGNNWLEHSGYYDNKEPADEYMRHPDRWAIGDVITKTGGHASGMGHFEVFDGARWVSDGVQSRPLGGYANNVVHHANAAFRRRLDPAYVSATDRTGRTLKMLDDEQRALAHERLGGKVAAQQPDRAKAVSGEPKPLTGIRARGAKGRVSPRADTGYNGPVKPVIDNRSDYIIDSRLVVKGVEVA